MRQIFLLIMILFPGFAAGQTVAVRGGEHEGFTRLVLDLPQPVQWAVTDGEELSVKLDGLSASFDYSQTMSRLGAGRVLGFQQSEQGDELLVQLSCPCTTRSSFEFGNMLVIDVFGVPNTAKPRRAVQEELAVVPDVAAESPGTPSVRLPIVIGADSRVFPPAKTAQSQREPQLLSEDTLTRTERSREAERKLLQQMGRVASQGLVEPHLRKMTPRPEPDRPKAKPENTVQQADLLPASEGRNIRAFSSIDRDFLLSQEAPTYNRDGQRCMEDAALSVQSWIGPEGFGEQIGALRAQIYGEFDRVDAKAAESLAKAYIGYGMGTEAAQVLFEVLEGTAPRYLEAMADIVEDGELRGAMPETWLSDCDSAAAFWALLAGREVGPSRPLNDAAVLRSFSALPTELRAHLAPFVSTRLQDAGKDELLSDIVRHAERGQPDGLKTLGLAAAQAEASVGKPESALAELEKVIQSNGEGTPLALIQKIDLLLKEGRSITLRDAELAEAYAQEYRKDELGPELARVALLARVAAGKFAESFEELAKISSSLTEERALTAASYILGEITQNAADLDFLQHAFSPIVEEVHKFSSDVEHLAAKRLLGMAFPDRALVFLSSATRGEFDRERKMLRAEAALQAGRYRQAEAELLGLHGKDVEAIRIKAKIGLDDHYAALLALETLGQTEDAAEQAWLAQDWENLSALETEEWQAEQALLDATATDGTEPPISQGKALLNETAELRELVAAVLARHDVEATPPSR